MTVVPGPAVRLHDTSTGTLVETRPEGPARLYVCGITPYDATHLGHAATMITFDLAYRAWLDAGVAVRYVQNVTDIDDPLLERLGTLVTDREVAAFVRRCDRLLSRDVFPSPSTEWPAIPWPAF